MIDALKAAYPAVEWAAHDAGFSGRNRQTWVYVAPLGSGYYATARHASGQSGDGSAATPESAVACALANLNDGVQAWAEAMAQGCRKWGQP